MEHVVLQYTADIVAVTVLTFGLYFRRHRRRDLVVAFLGVNIGVLAVTSSLGSGDIGAGLGLGLFGVLSIIRLRSTEIEQHEVAYYFSALALGILGGIPNATLWVPPSLMALVLLTLHIGDHPALLRRYDRQTLIIDGAVLDPAVLNARLEQLLCARVHGVTVQRLDLVNDTTCVDVRFERWAPPTPSHVDAHVGGRFASRAHARAHA